MAPASVSCRWIKVPLHSDREESDAALVQAQIDRVVEALAINRPAVARPLVAASVGFLASTALLVEARRQL